MPKVQCGVSVSIAFGESVAEGNANCARIGPLPHNRSLKSRLSLGVGDPERRNLADLFGPMGHACQKCNVASSGESVAEGTLTGPYWPRNTP
ncbi:hypothetical protein DPMN_092411 [Dreissena polymorpha]|uniref:Uncharacterized protein n=1 Tax=Dreissena polymorpha TaxID=45954 RepID=A0A9D4R007_DREPO|nr:hypothetical protein DPMN_092411 [Dreissena polymorpha]